MSIATGPAGPPQHPLRWWETRWFVAALILLAAVPLIYPPIKRLVRGRRHETPTDQPANTGGTQQ